MGTFQSARFLTYSGLILPGVRRVVKVPSPVADAEWSVAVPAGVQWRVLSGEATLQTSATVANRVPQIAVTVEGTEVGRYPSGVTLAAGSIGKVTFSQALPFAQVNANSPSGEIVLPAFNLPEGAVLSSSTLGLSAGDNYIAIAIYLEEYYLTDGQLSEIERDREVVERQLLQRELQTARTGAGA